MNNIYKVIWSKAKNCYVVASEIAKSHTKSASGQSVRRSALASLLALSLLCGGLGVAEASVRVNVVGGGTTEVYRTSETYTKTETDGKLALKADAIDVDTNTANINNLDGKLANLTTTVNGKADKTYVDTELTKKADVTALGEYAKTADVNTELAKKADVTALGEYAKTADVNTELAKKADATALGEYAKTADVNTELAKKADKATTLAGYGITDAYNKGEVYNRGEVAAKLNTKANQKDLTQATDRITANEAAITGLTTKTTEISYVAGDGTKISGVTIKDGNIVGNGNSAITGLTNVETGNINGKSLVGTTVATAKDVEDAVKAETDARTVADTALEGKINAEKTEREAKDNAILGRIGKVADDGNYIKNSNTNSVSKNLKALDAQAKINADAIVAETAARTNKDTELEGKINTLDGNVTTAQGDINDLKAKDIELEGRIHTNEGNIETNKNAIAAIDKRTAGIGRIDATSETTIENNVKVDSIGNVTAKGQLTAYDGVYTGTGDITTKGDVNAGSLNVENASHLKGDVTMDKTLSVTGDTKLKKTDVDGTLNVTGESSLKNTKVDGTLTTTGKATFQEAVEMDKGLTVTNGATKLKETTVDGKLTAGDADLKDTKVNGKLGVNGDTTLDGALTAKGEATFEKNVTVEKDLTVNGKLNVGEIYLENNKLDAATGKKHDSATAITADGISNLAKVTDHGHTTESQFTHNEKGTINYAKDGDTTDWKESTSNVTADGVKTEAKDSKGNRTNTSQTASENKTYLEDKDSKNTNSTIDTAKGYDKTIKGENGETSTKQDELNITNTAQKGTITNDAKDIVNNATGNMTNTVGADLTTTVGGNELHEVTGTKTENVTGKVTENYKAGQETNVTGDQDIYVTGKQTNKIDGEQVNTIGGDQTTTVEGNVKEDYKKDLTTTVGGNELHEVTGTKTENVTGKVMENYNGGQETNVIGNQDIKVSGTQTTTATDINRNASSSMVDKVDNAYGTNTETKEAGKTTTDVSIKGTGEKGQYIRGANESRDYLIKGTLMNSETKTAEATSTEITDATNKASTRQDAKNLAGSVTNGTETGVSGIHANDDGSVSIDSAVAGGGMSSVINQKKDSIQSAVGDGTNSTVIRQDKDNVTIASSNGTVAIVGKDIVNNASESITNKAKTMDTTVTGKATESYGELDTTVTGQATENFNGGLNTKVTGAENHTVTGKQTNTVEGGQENIISGGQINKITGDQTTTVTGKVTENYKAGQATNVTVFVY